MAGLALVDPSQAALPISVQTAYTGAPAAPPASGPWEPWVTTPVSQPPVITGPMGAGFRVPTIVVSPWTYQAGVSSQVASGAQFDHSSVIRYLEDITQVKCLPNLPEDPPLNWRRQTFSSLGILVDTTRQPASATEVASQLPSVAQADAWRTDLLTRLFDPGPTPVSVNLPIPGPAPLQAWPPLQQTCSVVANKTTFGLDEVKAAAKTEGSTTGSTFPAFWVILDGFDPAELNLGSLAPAGYTALTPDITLTVAGTDSSPPGITWTLGAVQPDGSTAQAVPQRFRFPVDIVFAADGSGNYPAFSDVTLAAPAYVTVQVSFTSHLTWTAASFELELVVAPDPSIQTGTISYLSTDLRAYTVYTDPASPGLFGVPYDTGATELDFVQAVIQTLNSDPAAQALFETSLNDDAEQEAVSTVTVFPTDSGNTGRPVANVAFARVTLQGLTQSAYNTRVFFRMCPAASTGTAFNPATLYRSTPLTTSPSVNPAGSQPDTVTEPNNNAPAAGQPGYPWLTRVPLLGIDGSDAAGTDVVTFPFFAVPRVTPASAMYDQPPDWPNTQTIAPAPGQTGEPVYAFFGCWLDINESGVAQFPATVPVNVGVDGPFAASAPAPGSIASLVRGKHQCLVAEIAYDEVPIPLGAQPGTNDKLAQRNLTVVGGTN
jgi:hypothetical protein